jgi:hypothetical protein
MNVWSRLALVLVSVAAVLLGGFELGARNPTVTVLHGSAYVGDGQAEGFAGGVYYGLKMDGPWQAADGNWVDSNGPPACLTKVGSTVPAITFGVLPVTGPGNESWNEVVWVSCAG